MSNTTVLEFERPIVELRKRIAALREIESDTGTDLSASIEQLTRQSQQLQKQVFANLTPWQRALLSRHPNRPYFLDYVDQLFTDWMEIHGDRAGFDDAAIVCGLARLQGRPVVVVGQQKGRNTKENLKRNFGMPRPDGYRKALRVMKLAARFGRPILTFIDTPGAFPGIDAEERGQAEAIARNIMEMATFEVPIICCVTGEGGSGGALALGVGNRVVMLENSIYSVISPEGCAAILWRDRAEGPRAAEALRLTASDCRRLGVVDEVIEEPPGGAHQDPSRAIADVGRSLVAHLDALLKMSGTELRADRYARYRRLGAFEEAQSALAAADAATPATP
jgi:acetyl-CoA carboxylase carboxyl transferase subunit alpha